MYALPYSGAQWLEYWQRLSGSHQVHIVVYVLNGLQQLLGEVSHRLIDGSLDIDSEANVTRSLKLKLLDVDRSLHFDRYNPADGAAFQGQMIRVYYGIGKLGPTDFMYVPIFTGPITELSRDGGVMDLVASGKEVLADGGMWTGMTWPAGWTVRNVISNAMQGYAGEPPGYMDLDFVPGFIGSDLPMEAGTEMFATLKRLASDSGSQLFYNGMGNLRLRSRPFNPVFTFNENYITDRPQVSYIQDRIVNAVRVEGGTPKGATGKYVYSLVAPPWHPLSPNALGRFGVYRYLPEFVSDDTLTNPTAIQNLAMHLLNNGLLQSTEVSFPSLVVPFLEEDDVVNVQGAEYFGSTRITKMTIPLVGDAEMSVGFFSNSSAYNRYPTGATGRMVETPKTPKKSKKSKKRRKGGKGASKRKKATNKKRKRG